VVAFRGAQLAREPGAGEGRLLAVTDLPGEGWRQLNQRACAPGGWAWPVVAELVTQQLTRMTAASS
jgi:hypothetical protein